MSTVHASSDDVPPSTPWMEYKKDLQAACDKMGHDAVLLKVTTDLDELLESSGVLERELGDGAPPAEELEGEAYLQACNGLSKEQIVNADLLYTCVPKATMELCDKNCFDMMNEGGRQNPGDAAIFMLDTNSSYWMYTAIGKQFTAATKEINKAVKQITSNGRSSRSINDTNNNEVTNVAVKALQMSMAAVMAANNVDVWRCDTEVPEEVEKICKRMVKFLRVLLWFTDAELGFHDVLFRRGLLRFLEDVCKNWNDESEQYGYSLPSLNSTNSSTSILRTNKNGNGMGRPLHARVDDRNPAPTKKARTTS